MVGDTEQDLGTVFGRWEGIQTFFGCHVYSQFF